MAVRRYQRHTLATGFHTRISVCGAVRVNRTLVRDLASHCNRHYTITAGE